MPPVFQQQLHLFLSDPKAVAGDIQAALIPLKEKNSACFLLRICTLLRRAVCRSFQMCKGQEQEAPSGTPVAPSSAFQCHRMPVTVGFCSCTRHNIEPGVRDLNSCPHNSHLWVHLPLCALHSDEKAEWHGGYAGHLLFALRPIPCPSSAGLTSRGLNYVSQAPLPTGFLFSLANGRCQQLREQGVGRS